MDVPQAEVERVQALGGLMQRQLAQHKEMLQRCTDSRSKYLAEGSRLSRRLTAARAEIDRLRDVLGSIDGMCQFILDDSAVSEKPKPTWREFADWVHEQVSEALKEE